MFRSIMLYLIGLPWWFSGKKSACSARDLGLIPGWRRSPGVGIDSPPPVFLPGQFHGQRSLVSYSPGDCTVSDITKATKHQQQPLSNYSLDFINFISNQLSHPNQLSPLSFLELICTYLKMHIKSFLSTWHLQGSGDRKIKIIVFVPAFKDLTL